MNLSRSRHPSKTCACNSCVHKREVLGYGSRIDKLYHNEYLPLRERKLLDKLVRTRSVYDDIRNRILSLSSVDIAKERELEGTQNSESDSDSSAAQVQELVRLIDRGEYPPLQSSVHLHSDCCGCCICSSKSRIHKRNKVHMHIPDKEHIDRYVESHRGKMRKDAARVAFKDKAARSDPCMCTLKFSKIPKKPKYVAKNHRSKANVADKSKKKAKKALVKCECKFEAAEETISNKSIALLRNAENKVRHSIRSTVTKIENVFNIKKDSLMIFRDQLKKKQEMKAWECDPDFCIPNKCNPDECYEKIKRREAKKIIQNSDTRKKHKVMQTQPAVQRYSSKENQLPFPRECEPFMCIPGECDPRDCKKILLKSSPAGHELRRCFCTQQLKQSQGKNKSSKTVLCKCKVSDSVSQTAKLQKPRLEKQKKKPPKEENESSTIITKSKTKILCECVVKDSVSMQTKKGSPPKLPMKEIVSVESTQTDKPQKPRIEKPKKKPKLKNKSSTTMKKSKAKILCKCEVKDSVSTQTKKESKPKERSSGETTPVIERKAHDLLPYECEPLFCIPGECNPLICEERIKKRKLTPRRKKTKPAAEKSISSPTEPRKQAVRIGSSFKFEIEFFKEKNFSEGLDNTNTSHIKRKVRSIKNNNEEYREPTNRSVSEVIIHRKEEQKDAHQASQDTFLKRCFCTLKLHKTPKQKPIPKRPKSKMTMTTKERKETIEQIICKCKPQSAEIIPSKSQASMTAISYVLPPIRPTHNLLPYECEPLFCVPGKCDPLVCEKQIQMRNLRPKTKSREINTEPKKSTRTITSKSATPYSENIQVPRRKKVKANVEAKNELHRKPQADKSKSAPNAPRKQAVKISSNFRFDIEFYKNINLPNKDSYNKNEDTLSTSSSAKAENIEKPRHKSVSVDKPQPQKVQETMSQTNNRKKSMLAISEPFKRCLCTLKLTKKPKKKIEQSVSKKTMTIKKEKAKKGNLPKTTNYTNISTQTKKVAKPKVFVKPPIPQSGLLPYECEPNFCVPGQCDPLICAERIKVRNKKEIDKEPLLKRCLCTLKFHNDNNAKRNRTVIPLQDNLEVTSLKSIGTVTKKMKKHQAKYANTEVPKIKSVYSETMYVNNEKSHVPSTQLVVKEDNASEKERLSSNTGATPAISRQSVKFSSEFSFDVEFYKNLYNKSQSIIKKAPKIKPKIGVKLTKEKSRKWSRHKDSVIQDKIARPRDSSINTESKLERCFCTLKLHKKGNNHLKAQTSTKHSRSRGHQQIYYVNKTTPAQFLKETNVSPCLCKPCNVHCN